MINSIDSIDTYNFANNNLTRPHKAVVTKKSISNVSAEQRGLSRVECSTIFAYTVITAYLMAHHVEYNANPSTFETNTLQVIRSTRYQIIISIVFKTQKIVYYVK